MARITRANKLTTDENGLITGEIVAIQDSEKSEYGNQLEWCIAVDTQKGTKAIMRFWTGKSVNSEKNYYPTEDSQPQYNKLTQVCLKLEVIDEVMLLSSQDIDIDLSTELEGKSVNFKTKPSERRRALKEIDISSLELVS